MLICPDRSGDFKILITADPDINGISLKIEEYDSTIV